LLEPWGHPPCCSRPVQQPPALMPTSIETAGSELAFAHLQAEHATAAGGAAATFFGELSTIEFWPIRRASRHDDQVHCRCSPWVIARVVEVHRNARKNRGPSENGFRISFEVL